MILFIIAWLSHAFNVMDFSVFTSYSVRMAGATITSLLFTVLLGPFFIRQLKSLNVKQFMRGEAQYYAKLDQLHQAKKNTPTMGGVLIICAILISLLFWMDLKHPFTLLLFLSTILLGALGAWDDYLKLTYKNSKGLSGKKKALAQSFVSLLIAAYLLIPGFSEFLHRGEWFAPPVVKEVLPLKEAPGEWGNAIVNMGLSEKISLQEYASRVYIPFFKNPVIQLSGLSILLMAFLIIFVIVGSSNAVNLTDGLDGLAAGCLVMVALCLALIAFVSNHIDLARYLNIAYVEGSGEIAIYLSAFVGACLGFLWFNGYPAEVIMGDTGSLALGGVIGVSAVLLKREFLLALVGGIFVAEALSVILQVGSFKLRHGKRVFLCAPLHHHFEYRGWPETKVVVRFWIVGLLLAIIGLASLKFQ
jgi:phospho-N-acetylmuramoyl-pentapeptide-transferase